MSTLRTQQKYRTEHRKEGRVEERKENNTEQKLLRGSRGFRGGHPLRLFLRGHLLRLSERCVVDRVMETLNGFALLKLPRQGEPARETR